MRTFDISVDYSPFTGLRHCEYSENSGEAFYHDYLNQAFKDALDANEKLTILLDGGEGYAPSFLDEAFGNLVYDFTLKIVKPNIILLSTQEPHWIDMIQNQTYLQWEERRIRNEPPKVTKQHKPWFRKDQNNNFISAVWETPVAA